MENNPALPDKKPTSGLFYTLILDPGIVRYLRFAVFLKAEIETVIASLNEQSPHLVVKSPADNDPTINFAAIDEIIGDQSWKDRLRIHHRIGLLLAEKVFSWRAYRQFHSDLHLNKNLAIAEFLEAWMPVGDDDLIESYKMSRNHMVLSHGNECIVFRKTDFVIGRLNATAKQAARKAKEAAALEEEERKRVEDQRVAENLETLKKSAFDTFVYLMEDLRNGAFKIGRSKTPSKRERTLQSEAPSVVLRLAIPSDERHEKQLHAHFNGKHLRGEWFSLTADELMWIVSFLKTNGDSARATVDHDWLGKLYFRASSQITDKK
jgi:hypothetical protein